MRRKNEILNAARSLFAEKGYDVSMSDIAGRIDIKTPSLYSHFGSKDEIISMVLESEIISIYDFFNSTIDRLVDQSAELKLKRLFFSVFEYFETPGKLEILRRIPFIDNETMKLKLTKIILEKDAIMSVKAKTIIQQGILSGEIRENVDEGAMLLYLAMIHGLLDTKLLQRYTESQMDDYSSSAWEAFWNGIKRQTTEGDAK